MHQSLGSKNFKCFFIRGAFIVNYLFNEFLNVILHTILKKKVNSFCHIIFLYRFNFIVNARLMLVKLLLIIKE